MKKILLATCIFAVGCSTSELGQLPVDVPAVPTNEWLKNHYPTYKAYADANKLSHEELVVYDRLTKLVKYREKEAIYSIEKSSRVNKELTMVYGNQGRTGPAIKQPGFIHVLANKPEQMPDKGNNYLLNGDVITNTLNAMPDTDSRMISYTHYELSRWERYCSNGKGMDEKDWLFVKKANYVWPKETLSTCNAPDYKYEFYVQAWTSFCTSSSYGETEKRVVRHSVKPTSLTITCKL